MGKTHAVAWVSESPTPAQLKELFAQIESGRMTKRRLQECLSPTEEMVSQSLLGFDLFLALLWSATCRVTQYLAHILMNEILLVTPRALKADNEALEKIHVVDGAIGTCLFNAIPGYLFGVWASGFFPESARICMGILGALAAIVATGSWMLLARRIYSVTREEIIWAQWE